MKHLALAFGYATTGMNPITIARECVGRTGPLTEQFEKVLDLLCSPCCGWAREPGSRAMAHEETPLDAVRVRMAINAAITGKMFTVAEAQRWIEKAQPTCPECATIADALLSVAVPK